MFPGPKRAIVLPMRRGVVGAALTAALLAVAGCGDGGSLEPAELTASCDGGPRVIFDPLTEHTPEVPLPNDVATVIDTSSPTGRRVNVRIFAPTVFEQAVRRGLSSLDGWGTFAPITVAFDADHPIDLHSITSDPTRIGQPGTNSVLLVDLGATEPYWGSRFAPLDTRNGTNFPIHIQGFPFPPGGRSFPPYTYGTNARGETQAFYRGEEIDEQLAFRPDNREDLDGDGVPELLSFYEKETNTLILRPILPLRPKTQYVMVVTKGVHDRSGGAACAPANFPYTAHATQVDAVRAALPHLAAAGVSADDIAFAWSFTTQSISDVFDGVAAGLDGQGSLGHLQAEYPPVLSEVTPLGVPFLEKEVAPGIKNPYLLDVNVFGELLEIVTPLFPEIGDAMLSFENVDYCVLGQYQTTNFRATPDELFDIDLASGRATVGVEDVPFLLCVPKATAAHQPPFPVALYCHGNQSIRFEAIASANALAKNGVAVMAIDAVGHGPILSRKDILDLFEGLPPSLQEAVLRLLSRIFGTKPVGDTPEEIVDNLLKVGFFDALGVQGRAVDLSGDGYPDNGANFWSADTFKTRDVVRQTVIDLMRLMRILEHFDQAQVPAPPSTPPAKLSPEEAFRHLGAGDFNMDGVLDVGGTTLYAPYAEGGKPEVAAAPQRYFQTGISLGGIVSSVMIGAERRIVAGAPVVPGGGLTDVMLRSDLKDVMYRIYYEVLGPVFIGEPAGGGATGQTTVRAENNLRRFDLGTLAIRAGGRIHGLNLVNGEEKWADVMADGGFVIGVAADEGDPVSLESFDASGTLVGKLDVTSPLRGFGLDRNTPRFRRFVGLAQMTLEPADPINYGVRWFVDPPAGWPAKNVLQLTDPGDLTVPINNQIALARAAGLLGKPGDDLAALLAKNDWLAERQVLLGLDRPESPFAFPLYDPEDADGNNCSMPRVESRDFACADGDDSPYCRLCRADAAHSLAPFPPVDTGNGRAALRLPFGKRHEYHALPRPAPDYAPGYYGVYTQSSQGQMGAFLGAAGSEWRPEWDCRIQRTWQPDPNDPSREILVSTFEDGCPWKN